MPNNHESPQATTQIANPRPAWVILSVALLPVLACFLGGTTEKWAEGIVVGVLGLLLIFSPPRHSLGPWLNAIIIALLAVASLSFLPAHWFSQSWWRSALINDFGIKLPSTLSPQPWITLGCLISFGAGLAWFYYVCAPEFEMRDVRFQVRVFASGMALLAALSIFLYSKGTAISFWHNQRGFGPFPNRNQTGDLFGITAIVLLASAQDHFRRGKKSWILSVLGFGIVVAALILNYSRAGILILIAGSAIWLAVITFRQRSPAKIAIGFSVVLVLLTTMLIFGGSTLERFHLRGGATADGISNDFRWLIFRDAWHLIWTSPWCGIGLGNFEPIFAISRVASVADTRSLHPESDWLWLWTELGWPGHRLGAHRSRACHSSRVSIARRNQSAHQAGGADRCVDFCAARFHRRFRASHWHGLRRSFSLRLGPAPAVPVSLQPCPSDRISIDRSCFALRGRGLVHGPALSMADSRLVRRG